MIDLAQQLIDLVQHLPEHLATFVREHGAWAYGLLALTIFCETGLVVLPFLPGDSLLFACGALVARGTMHLPTVCAVIIAAAFLGDNCNYWIGRILGPRLLKSERSRFFSRKNHDRTHAFFEKHGGKAVIFARFVPIVRTFAPFTAGVGAMNYAKFLTYSIIGTVLWVGICVSAGYFFGEIPFIKTHFSLVVLGIVGVSLIPILFELVLARRRAKRSALD